MSEFLDFVNIALVIVMAVMGWMFKIMHGQAKTTLDAINEKLKQVDAHSTFLAEGKKEFENVHYRLNDHAKVIGDHEQRIRGLEKTPHQRERLA